MLRTAPPVFRLCDLVRIAARRQPDAVAIEHEFGTMTYRQFDGRVLKCANALVAQGLEPGDRVVIFARNGHEFLELYMGLQFAGLIAVPVNFRLSAAELGYVLTNSGARGIAVGEEFMRTYDVARAQVEVPPASVVVLGRESDHENAYERLLAKAPSTEPLQRTSAFSPAAIFYTSGTTGFPKGAVLSHLALLMRFSSWGWRFGITEEDVLLVPGPVFHQSFGSISILALCTGGRLLLHTDFDAPKVIEALATRGVTWSFLVPKMHASLVEAIGTSGPLEGCGALRGLMSSGSTLPTPVLRGLADAFPTTRLCDTYGWTESGWITYCRHEDVTRGTRTVGKASYGCELAILDDGGERLPPGEVGQIYAANPIPFMGYHDNPEATAAMRRGKWETGGDVGLLDEQGFLQIFDRKRDMIVSGGENIYPAEIERVLAEHPKVLEVAVVGVPDALWGESPRACVVPKAGENVSDAELFGFCIDKLAKFKHPKSVCLFDVLPRNSMGKVLRRELRERFWNESKAAWQ